MLIGDLRCVGLDDVGCSSGYVVLVTVSEFCDGDGARVDIRM